MNIRLYIREKLRLLYIKMIREKAPPEYIARGWAIGMFWSLAMPLGAQLVFSLPFAFLFKGSKIGAVFGTFLTNPVTILVIYPAQCWIGNRILGGNLTFSTVIEFLDVLKSVVLCKQNWRVLQDLDWDVLFPFFVGGAFFGGILAVLTYYGVLVLVKKHRSRKRRARSAKVREC